MSGGDWRWDDTSISASDKLYRHVPQAPNPKKRVDPVTGEWSLTQAAFKTNEMHEDGWSVYRDELMQVHKLTLADIENSGEEPREAWTFDVSDVRTVDGCGVIDEVDYNTLPLGNAHALVRCDSPKPAKQKIVALRNRLIDRAKPA